jgi:Xaa-Pro aminopeptidase
LNMITHETYAARRTHLSQRVSRPIMLVGCGTRLRNLPINELPFRQDSSFLYLTGCNLPNAAVIIEEDHCTLFLPAPADDDALWHGHVKTLEDHKRHFGVDAVIDIELLDKHCKDRKLATLAVADVTATQRAATLAGVPLSYGKENGDDLLIDALIAMRQIKDKEEIDELRAAAICTAQAFHAAMAATHPGGTEAHVAALFRASLAARGLSEGYKPIVTVRGEILHNPTYRNSIKSGQLLLLDGGGERSSGYTVDITRTWPVSGRFQGKQGAAYSAVLDAQLGAIELVRPGIRYREVHDRAAAVLTQWLRDEGLLRGTMDELRETQAHAAFFPHGIGHHLGLDVHDLEQFGDRAAYPPGRGRDGNFGTAYLRMDMDMAPGMVVTVEPGFYVVPAILRDPALREKWGSQVDWDLSETWTGFGGIRIEDDVLCTDSSPEVLTATTIKDVHDLEDLVGSGIPAIERFRP